MKFRDLRADEIEVRVATVKENGCSLLLYKDARADMIILDECVGPENWQRHHSRDNANCTVSIWCESKKQWIQKEDTGTESYTEKEKGQASDSFKRACFNWGIGRELYTAPFIWIKSDKADIKKKQDGKTFTTYDTFKVSEIVIENKKIIKLTIVNSKTGNVCYAWSKSGSNPKQETNDNSPSSESVKALNSTIAKYVKASGKTVNDVVVELAKTIGKNTKNFTEEDTQKALQVIKSWPV